LIQKSPEYDIPAQRRTEYRVAYDDNFFYVAIVAFDSTNHVVSTLKRDIGFWDGDGVGVVLDPLNRATSGFMFATGPHGVQTDVAVGGGSGPQFYDGNWDNRWFVETSILKDRYIVEMAIPFKTLRYESNKDVWGINFFRNNKKLNCSSMWAKIPRQFWFIDLGYTGKLQWDEAPKKTSNNIALIPYINTNSFTDFEEKTDPEFGLNVGVDAKVALSPTLNLDLTVNPDFSQVEVDQQVTNLTRFSIFLPERRTFFLENSDIFTRFGNPLVRPFFSRRIGLDEDGRAVPIRYGGRLSGNISSSTRIGLLNVQTKGTDDQLAQNYSTAVVNQRVFGRSQLKAMFINRQGILNGEFQSEDYGRNGVFEFNYANKEGTIEAWTGYQHSFKEGISADNFTHSIGAAYAGKVISAVFDWTKVGTNYFADVGFVNRIENYDALRDTTIRLGFNTLYMPFSVEIWPKNPKGINRHAIDTETLFVLDPEFKFVERNIGINYRQAYSNSSSLSIGYENNETDLRFPFSFTDDTPLPVGRYEHHRFGISYDSDERKLFQYFIEASTGGFYNGNLNQLSLSINYRRQPWGSFGIGFEYNKLKFPEPYGEQTILAFSPRAEISFHRNLFWTTFMQYNTQLDNFIINSRLQWRFAPMSDLFFVYTDNYAVENFGPKNRAFVLRFNYWLAL
ncbi:MAG: DUF5916 domain-containing protein, partial [Bacteroidota bacterium]